MAAPEPYRGSLAVLTGDIIGSSKLDPASFGKVVESIRNAVGTFMRVYPGGVIGEADIYRGDSWQIAMSAPQLSLRFAIYMRAVVIGGGLADTRVSIGIGSGNTILRDRISQSIGDAFLRSGRELDAIGARRMAFAMSDAPSDTDTLSRCLVMLLDNLVAGWTVKQADAARRVLENPNKPDADVAGARLSDSGRRNFTKLRKRANVEQILDALVAFEGLACWKDAS